MFSERVELISHSLFKTTFVCGTTVTVTSGQQLERLWGVLPFADLKTLHATRFPPPSLSAYDSRSRCGLWFIDILRDPTALHYNVDRSATHW